MKVIRVRYDLSCFSQQHLIVPPEAGIDGDVSLKNRRPTQKGVQREQTSQRVSNQDPVGKSPVLPFNVRNQFFLQESLKGFSATARSVGLGLFAIGAFDAMRRRQVSVSYRVGYRNDDCLRNLDVAI